MKIIALMPVKDEAWILNTTMPILSKYVDEIIALDDSENDNSREIIQSFGGLVIPQGEKKIEYSTWRQRLLDLARERGGTHFIWLDADECFTANFGATLRARLMEMKSGQAIFMDWLCLWKSPYHVRFDNSVWTFNVKDFIFCDDETTNFENVAYHEPRTPVKRKNIAANIYVSRDEGAVLHFQFVPFERFQLKQAYIQCREYVLLRHDPGDMNKQYAITLDSPGIMTKRIPNDWTIGIPELDTIALASGDRFKITIFDYFDKYGIEHFEPLNIWHIKDLKIEFLRRTGRTPLPKVLPRSINEFISDSRFLFRTFLKRKLQSR